MQISAFIGKPVLTRTGEHLGYVTAVRFARDFSRVSCLVCADGEEEEFFLPARAILSAGDAVFAGGQRFASAAGVESPVGRAAYLSTGEALGTVADLETEPPSLIVRGARGDVRIPVAQAAVGESVVVYASEKQRRAAGTSARPAKRSPVKISPSVPAAEQAAVRLGGADLLGRTVKRNVFDDGGNPVARAGERITAETLRRARLKNRLLTLAVNTLTDPERT